MSTTGRTPVIPPEMLPNKGVTQTTDDVTAERVLLVNDVMFTGMRFAQGSLSERFFIPLRDNAKLMGAKCPTCGEVDCPPFQLKCPSCNFTAMEPVELPDQGVMMASVPIVMFPPAMFKDEVPYGNGYVLLDGAHTGLNVRCRTTTGMLRPGIFRRDTRVKVVFKRERQGIIRDICLVPVSELTPEQVAQSPLFEDEINWQATQRPQYEPDLQAEANLQSLLEIAPQIQTTIATSGRALKDLGDWQATIQVWSAGGPFIIRIDNGNLMFQAGTCLNPTFEMAVRDPAIFLHWWNRTGEALTNGLMDGSIWLSTGGTVPLQTIFKLDRLPRSVSREHEA